MTETAAEAARVLRQHIADSRGRERITVTAARLTMVLDAVENSGHAAPAPQPQLLEIQYQDALHRADHYWFVLQQIVALRGYQGEDMGRVAGYRVAADIAEKALKDGT